MRFITACINEITLAMIQRQMGREGADFAVCCATQHRHSYIAARAGSGDLLIGAAALMCEATDRAAHERCVRARKERRAESVDRMLSD